MTIKTDLVLIPGHGGPDERTLAVELVERGNVKHAIVEHDGYTIFEAYRVSETSYAWRSSGMAAPAFGTVKPDTRPDVYGMPRWQWDLNGKGL